MTVKQLIAHLQEQDSDAEIEIHEDYYHVGLYTVDRHSFEHMGKICKRVIFNKKDE